MPRVEFTLKLENYLDWARNIHMSARPSFVKKALTLSLLLVSLGFLFARWSANDAPPAGAIAVIVGFLLAVLSLPIWLLLERPQPGKEELHLRGLFERFYQQPRQLEFDDSGWSFKYGAAVNARPWEDLVSFADYGRTIVLADTFVYYPLAAAAFTGEQRKLLKDLCEQSLLPEPKLMSVSMFASRASYARSMVVFRWRKRTLRMLSLYALGSVFATLVGIILANTMSVQAVFVCVGMMLLMPIAEMTHGVRKFNSNYAPRTFHSAEVSQNSICFRKPLELRKVRLDWFTEYFETPWEIQLFVSDDLFYLLPKSSFSPKQLVEFRALLSASLNSAFQRISP